MVDAAGADIRAGPRQRTSHRRALSRHRRGRLQEAMIRGGTAWDFAGRLRDLGHHRTVRRRDDAYWRGSPPHTHGIGTRSDTMSTTCSHLDQIQDVTPSTPGGCEECLQTGDTWVHLRICLTSATSVVVTVLGTSTRRSISMGPTTRLSSHSSAERIGYGAMSTRSQWPLSPRDDPEVAIRGGIGVAISLCFTEPAFDPGLQADAARTGIPIGLVVAGAIGYIVLSSSLPSQQPEQREVAPRTT